MLTQEQKDQMKANGTPDATRDVPAAQKMKAELDALIAQMEAEAERHLEQTKAFAAAITEIR